MTNTRIVTRADDAGMAKSANNAILETIQTGIIKNVSLMANGTYIEHAADLFRDLPDIDLGLHICFNCEWSNPRFGGVLPPGEMPSLVEDDGTFTTTPDDLSKRNPSRQEMMDEIMAQLQRLRDLDLNIAYMDEHMGVGWVADVADEVSELAKAEDLVWRPPLKHIPNGPKDTTDPIQRRIEGLKTTTPGTDYLWLGHPCYNDEEMSVIKFRWDDSIDIGFDRDIQRQDFLDPAIVTYVNENNLIPTRYSEL